VWFPPPGLLSFFFEKDIESQGEEDNGCRKEKEAEDFSYVHL